MPMPDPDACDGCRHCPSTYPGKGLKGEFDDHFSSNDPCFDWRGTCSLGHRLWVVLNPSKDYFYLCLCRYGSYGLCVDREELCVDQSESYSGPRVSRYHRTPVI
jgi:hypothetical protein